MRVLFLIPREAAPTLADKSGWSSSMHDFIAKCLVLPALANRSSHVAWLDVSALKAAVGLSFLWLPQTKGALASFVWLPQTKEHHLRPTAAALLQHRYFFRLLGPSKPCPIELRVDVPQAFASVLSGSVCRWMLYSQLRQQSCLTTVCHARGPRACQGLKA